MSATTPDFERLGGLAWTRRTGGRLTAAERRRLLGAIAVGQLENVAGRARLALGRFPARAAEIEVSDFAPPDSRLAKEAEEACREQPAIIAGHCYRAWMFGLALAALDRVALDPELFYCGALVHDHGLSPPVAGADFTLRSAERALSCAHGAGLDTAEAELMADGICCHTTPGVSLAHDGALACYIQWGAMVDGAGLRAWDISRANVQTVLAGHPRGPGFKRDFAAVFTGEAKAVPGGRFALLARCGVPLAVRLAPFSD